MSRRLHAPRPRCCRAAAPIFTMADYLKRARGRDEVRGADGLRAEGRGAVPRDRLRHAGAHVHASRRAAERLTAPVTRPKLRLSEAPTLTPSEAPASRRDCDLHAEPPAFAAEPAFTEESDGAFGALASPNPASATIAIPGPGPSRPTPGAVVRGLHRGRRRAARVLPEPSPRHAPAPPPRARARRTSPRSTRC